MIILFWFTFQQYVSSGEKEFASATIQVIGKIASSVPDIADACLGGLISLLSNKDGESHVRLQMPFNSQDR